MVKKIICYTIAAYFENEVEFTDDELEFLRLKISTGKGFNREENEALYDKIRDYDEQVDIDNSMAISDI